MGRAFRGFIIGLWHGGEVRTLFEGTRRNTGLEVAGDFAKLLKHR